MAKLTVKFQGKVVQEIHVSPNDELTIGRDRTNGLVLDNPAVSRFHARVFKAQWPFFLEDLGSTNGTFINGSKIHKYATMKNKDVITIGKYKLLFNSSQVDYNDGGGEPFNPDSTIAM